MFKILRKNCCGLDVHKTWIYACSGIADSNNITTYDDVFSDVLGKSARSIAKYILAHPGEQFDVTPFIHGRCKHPLEEIQAAVDGAMVITKSQALTLLRMRGYIIKDDTVASSP